MSLRGLVPVAALMACCIAQQRQVDSPFACNLKALTSAERKQHEQLTVMLFTSTVERRELPDGYAFRFPAAISMSKLAQWVDNERKCCPFFDFQLEQGREQGALWMRLTGRAGVKQFIREEFRF